MRDNSVKQALEAAVAGCDELRRRKIPYRRPDDYYAEMVKSDQHMARVLQRLGEEKLRVEASEAAKRQREMRKFGKTVQKEKEKQREEARQRAEDAVKEWRKKHTAGEEFPIELAEGDDALPLRKSARKGAGDHSAGKRKGRNPLARSVTGSMVLQTGKRAGAKKPGPKKSKAAQRKRRH